MTKIEWTDKTINFFRVETFADAEGGAKTGWYCVKVSPGCANCYASNMSTWRGTGHEFLLRNAAKLVPRFELEKLQSLTRSRKAYRIFPNDMTDTFLSVTVCGSCGVISEHPGTPPGRCQHCGERYGESTRHLWPTGWVQTALDLYDDLARRGHVIQSLTKRPQRMFEEVLRRERRVGRKLHPQVGLGFSAENQKHLEERLEYAAKAARCTESGQFWISAEPLLGPVDLRPAIDAGVSWVVIGGESGRAARRCEADWIERAVSQLRAAGVATFVKQTGSRLTVQGEPWPQKHSKGGDPSEWPPYFQDWPREDAPWSL